MAIFRNEYFSDWKSSQCFNTKTVTVLFPGGSRVLEAPAFVSAQVFKAFKENPLRGSCASLDKNSHSMKVIWEKLCILDKHEHLAFEELKKLTLCHTTKPIPYSKTAERVTKTGYSGQRTAFSCLVLRWFLEFIDPTSSQYVHAIGQHENLSLVNSLLLVQMFSQVDKLRTVSQGIPGVKKKKKKKSIFESHHLK